MRSPHWMGSDRNVCTPAGNAPTGQEAAGTAAEWAAGATGAHLLAVAFRVRITDVGIIDEYVVARFGAPLVQLAREECHADDAKEE